MKKTIAQQLNVKEFPFIIKDSNGNKIYYENSNGFWGKSEFDDDNNEIYYENSKGNIRNNKAIVELTLDEIAEKLNINVKNLKIKK